MSEYLRIWRVYGVYGGTAYVEAGGRETALALASLEVNSPTTAVIVYEGW